MRTPLNTPHSVLLHRDQFSGIKHGMENGLCAFISLKLKLKNNGGEKIKMILYKFSIVSMQRLIIQRVLSCNAKSLLCQRNFSRQFDSSV